VWSTEKLSAEEVREFLLAKDKLEQTFFQIAAKRGKTEVLQKVWEWSTKKLSAEDINKLLLAKDSAKKQPYIVPHSVSKQLCYRNYYSGKLENVSKLGK